MFSFILSPEDLQTAWSHLKLFMLATLPLFIALYLAIFFVGKLIKKLFNLPLSWEWHIFSFISASTIFFIHQGLTQNTKRILLSLVIYSFYFVFHKVAFRLYARKESSTRMPKLVIDLLSIFALLVSTVIVLEAIYDVSIPGLLEGAGIASIAIGFAAQETLKDLFGGTVIHFGKVYQVGDWIKVEEIEGKVLGIYWRYTLLETSDKELIKIPNSEVVNKQMTAYYAKGESHVIFTEFHVSFQADPEKVTACCDEALRSTHLICYDKHKSIEFKQITPQGCLYQIEFTIPNHDCSDEALSHLHSHLWYALGRHHLTFFDKSTYTEFVAKARLSDPKPIIERAIERYFAPLGVLKSDVQKLIEHSQLLTFSNDEAIIRQGDPAGPFYILVSGRASVSIYANGQIFPVSQIEPWEGFGETALLNEPRKATVTAHAGTQVIEISLEGLMACAKACPKLVEAFAHTLALKCMDNDQKTKPLSSSEKTQKLAIEKENWIKKLKTIFEL